MTPKPSNKPRPEHLTPPPSMGDEYYRAMAQVRQAQAEWHAAMDSDPWWSEPADD